MVSSESKQTNQCPSIPRLLETRADGSPNAAAIIGQNREPLTFRRLCLQAHEVVKTLNALGVGRNDRVAAILPNGPEMAAAFLTISSGAAFAPLNPKYRANEFDFFLSDLKPRALVVQAGELSPGIAVAQDHSIPIIELLPTGTAEAGYFALKGHELSQSVCAGFAETNDVALILHTSGTTSRPKLISLTHSNLLASASNIAAVLRLTEKDRCLNIMPLFHIHGLIGAVLSSVVAGSSVMCTVEFNAPEVLNWLEKFLPTWYTAVPTMHQAIVERVKENHRTLGRSSLRFIRSCSAPLPAQVLTDLEDRFQVPVIEAYGMTEASHQIASNPLPPNPRKRSSVGMAAGTEIAIVSESGEFLPRGETGEIVIRGSGLTQGYENDPAANLNAFVHGWFRTGDLGYLDEDGYLFITGRLKEIINRGGEKISPAEVDKVLMDHPAVAQATTFAMPHRKLGEDVAAAVVLRANASATERDLQHFVALRLTDHKVPRRIVIVDEIPKSATGKLQRLGLAEKLGLTSSDGNEVRPGHEFVVPRTSVEDALAKIWVQVLRIEPVGVHDNFFHLGGDSILAAQVISRVRDALQEELSFVTFFDAPTLGEMAASIDSHDRHRPRTHVSPISSVPRDVEPPLSFGQQRLWFFDQLEPGSPVYNRAAFLRLRGRLNWGALQNSLNEIVRRHEVVRTTFPSIDGRPRQVVLPPSDVTVSAVDLRELPEASREAEARRLAIEESLRPFDLTSDLLLRAKVLQLGDQENVLILTMHHIAFDGWSDGILFHELSTLYKAYLAGLPSPLPELPIQYVDFAVWQRTSLAAALEEHLAYWKQQLAGAPSLLKLSTDRPRPPTRTFRGARHTMCLAESLSDALRILSRREDVTLYILLLAAFNALLYRYTGQHEIVVGTPIAGRTCLETENLIGVFINTIVLRTDRSGNPPFREFLRRVREAFLAGYAHSDLPFEKLVEALQPKRDMSRNPLFQVMFQLRNAPKQALELPELWVEELDLDVGLTKLDLTLEIVERDGSLTCWFHYNTDLFDGTTIARMAGHYQMLLDALVANPERRLLDPALILEQPRATKAPPLFGRETDDTYERSNLTKNQLLFWAGQKLRPDAPLYNIPYAFHLSGEIDRDHFQKAFQTLLNSSDALRTVIQEIDGIPQQSVLPDSPFEIEFHDLSSLPEPGAAVQAWLNARGQVLFDFQRRLFDCALVKLSDRRFVWFLNLHHIIADSRTIELVFRHVAHFYERSVSGCLEKRAELPVFKEYIEYEREYRDSPRSREAESYWEKKLAQPCEPLRFYGKNSGKKTTWSKKITCELGAERTLKLKQLASRVEFSVKTEHASIFNILAAVLSTYLYRVTGSRFLAIGAPFHNRRSKAFRDTIGLLMEVLPLRVTIEEDDTFVSLIRKIAFEAYTAFRTSHSIGNSPRNRLYDVLLNYDPLSFPRFLGLAVQMERLHPGHETNSLGLRIRDMDGGRNFVIDFEFHCDVFDASERDRAVQHFLRILDGFLENPNQALDEVNLLTDTERERILADFSRSQRLRLDNLCLPQLFETQVRRTPDHPAVFIENQSLTYAQLNSKANQLAHYLRSLGVKPGTFVGICTERSLEMVVGLMGILKAGAAYVPLDPSSPKERLAFVLSDTRMPVLLSQDRVAANLSEHAAKVICLDSAWTSISQMSSESPLVEVTAAHPAYVIYTSGSTGRPKGVEITHGALANFVETASDAFALGPGDRVLQFSSMSFDAAVEEIFPSLIRGARLVLRTNSMLDSVSIFLERCRDWQITVLDLPTAYWHEMTETLYREKLPLPETIRLVIIGGERAVAERLSQWQASVGNRVRLLNTYGPTETTVVSTMWELTGCESSASLGDVPIGRPIPNVQTYILDKRLNPTPIGVYGELHIGGAGLAPGYLNRPDLTAEKFLPNPFNNEAGARLYKTGDLARYLPDGNIEFVGRIDHQAKIRGYRIEPGEIEAVLRQHPAVQDALVIAREDASSGKRLVAYVVFERDVSTSVSDLRNSLKEKLPDYMIPGAYVFLESLPLTSTGKIDRSALAAPDQSRPEQETLFVPPATPEEEIIAGIWAQVLHLDRVGVHDNFFDLGGHSLLAIQVVSRVGNEFKIELPLRVLFEHPTVVGLASTIAGLQPNRPDAGEMVDILSELESLSDEEAQRMIDERKTIQKINFDKKETGAM